MSGYAFYVWTSYGTVFIAMLINFMWPLIQRRQLIHKLRQAQLRQEKLARRQQT